METHITSHSISHRGSRAWHLFAMSLTLLMVIGCTEKPKAATQVAAKVNNDEISVHQINNVVANLPQVTPENRDQVSHEVLVNLVKQQLAVQQAIEQKLDRSPAVMMQIDASKREILARAYLNQIVSSLPKPGPDDAKKFYDAHPELFAQRRTYVLQEISLQMPYPSVDELQKLVSGKSMSDIEATLKQRNIAYVSNSGTRVAEQIPLPILTQLAKMQDGQIRVLSTPQSAAIVHLDSSKLTPADESLAMQGIPQYLMNEQAKIAISDDLERLKHKAKIEYSAGYFGDQKIVEKTHTAMPAILPSGEAKAANKPEMAAEKDKTQSVVEKGITGIN